MSASATLRAPTFPQRDTNYTTRNEFELLNEVVMNAWEQGGADIALPDLDPDAILSANFLMNEVLPTEGTNIYSGDGSRNAINARAPRFAHLKIHPIQDLRERDTSKPLFLLDASRIDQPNVGGPKEVVPDVVLDTHAHQKPIATKVALLSDKHVATGSIVAEYCRQKFGDFGDFWDSPNTRQNAAGLRFGIFTDSGEENYGTSQDNAALKFLSGHSDENTWKELLGSPFFLKVQALTEFGCRVFKVKRGLCHVDLEQDQIGNCRDYLGAVADRMLRELNGVSMLITGTIEKGGEPLLCAALRLNRHHRAFQVFQAKEVLKVLSDHGGGFGSQVNGEVWGGSLKCQRPEGISRDLVNAYWSEGERCYDALLAV